MIEKNGITEEMHLLIAESKGKASGDALLIAIASSYKILPTDSNTGFPSF